MIRPRARAERLRKPFVALLAFALLAASALALAPPAGAQNEPTFDVQVRARLQTDGDIEFSLRADGQILTPTLRIFGADVSAGRRLVSSVVELHGVQLQVTARRQADGDVEFGIRADGVDVLRRQIFPADTRPNRTLVSRAVSVQSPDDPGDLTIYSGRGESLVGELIERFEEKTGIDVRVRYGGTSELSLTIGEEGSRSPADLFYGQDAGALSYLAEAGLAGPLPADILAAVENENFKDDDGLWIATSGRARVMIISPERVPNPPDSVFDLVDPEWKGRIGWAPTNGSFEAFVTAMRVIHGEDVTEEWLRGMIDNDVRVYASNTSQVQAVIDGELDIGLVNHYYRFRTNFDGTRDAAVNHFPSGDAGEAGALINIAGVAMLDSTSNQSNALRFIRFLLSEEGQTYFRDETNEYPVAAGVEPRVDLPSLDSLNPPSLALTSLSDLDGTVKLLRKVGAIR